MSFVCNFCSFLFCIWLQVSKYYLFHTMKCQGLNTHWVKGLIVLHSDWQRKFLLFVHLMYASGLLGCWSCACSSPGTLAYHYEMVLFATCTAFPTKCQALPLPVCCTTAITVVYFQLFGSALWAVACQLLQFSPSFLCDQSLLHL